MQKWLAKTISCKNNFDVKAGKAKLFYVENYLL